MKSNKFFLFILAIVLIMVIVTSYNLTKISIIEVYETQGFDIKPNTLKKITEPADIKVIQKTFRNAKKMSGIPDVIGPDYLVKINSSEYYLWANTDFEQGSIMKKNDTHTLYIIPSTTEILEIIKHSNNQ